MHYRNGSGLSSWIELVFKWRRSFARHNNSDNHWSLHAVDQLILLTAAGCPFNHHAALSTFCVCRHISKSCVA